MYLFVNVCIEIYIYLVYKVLCGYFLKVIYRFGLIFVFLSYLFNLKYVLYFNIVKLKYVKYNLIKLLSSEMYLLCK